MASWLSIVREVRDVDPPRRYAALLEDRLGPFAMRADLDLTVETRESRGLHVSASGEDRQVGIVRGGDLEEKQDRGDAGCDLCG